MLTISPLDCLCDEGDDLGQPHPNCPAHGERHCAICGEPATRGKRTCARCRSGKPPKLTARVIAGLQVVEKLAWADLESSEANDEAEYRFGNLACCWIRATIAAAQRKAASKTEAPSAPKGRKRRRSRA